MLFHSQNGGILVVLYVHVMKPIILSHHINNIMLKKIMFYECPTNPSISNIIEQNPSITNSTKLT